MKDSQKASWFQYFLYGTFVTAYLVFVIVMAFYTRYDRGVLILDRDKLDLVK